MREGESREYMVRIRYRQPLQRATLEMRGEGLYIVFDEPQRGIAAGQFAAWYEGEVLAGSGVIEA
jgi:tRNA-specific 2-thiouridylase